MKRTLLQRTTYYKTPFDEMSRIDKPETESRPAAGWEQGDCGQK